MSSSSSHQPSPSSYGHLNNISNNIGGGGSNHNHNNSHHQQEYDAEFEDGDNNESQQQDQQQQQHLFEDGPVLDDDNMDDSEEDTEEASETEMGSSSNHRAIDEPIEIKEQMYQDKLASLKKQLEELRSGQHPEYVRRVKKLEHQYNERIRLNDIYREYLISCVERDYILEKNAAVKEYEEKKIDLRENLMTDFEDRRKMIENERSTMELTGDSVDLKPTVTRKLRRRPNEPLPVPEKRRKPTSGQLVLLLDEKEVENDLKLISRGKVVHAMRPHNNSTSSAAGSAATGNGTAASGAGQQNATTSSSASSAGTANLSRDNYQQMNNSSAGGPSSSNEISIPSLSSSSVPSTAASVAIQQNPGPQNTPTQVQSQVQNQNQNNHQPQQVQQPAQSNTTSGQQSSNGQQTQSQPQPQSQPQAQTPQPQPAPPAPLVETRIEDGKLLYERRWFHRGQPVYVEGKDIPRFSAHISAIGSEAIWVKKTSDGQKVRIFTNQLSRGKVSIKRRAN